MPLHYLCCNKNVDEAASIQILKLLIEKHPGAVRHADNSGRLPIHLASGWRSPEPEFCRVLLEAYPGSEQIPNANGVLPLHCACAKGSLATVEYLLGLFPDAINHATTGGMFPIHYAIECTTTRDNPVAAVAVVIVQFLLNCDPDQELKRFQGRSLLHLACGQQYIDSNIEAGIQIIGTIYDVLPEAIEENLDIHHYHPQVQAFINSELFYARQAKNLRLMMTPDGNGQLPLHTALQNNVRLGSIKLLVKGNPSAIRNIDDCGALPLLVACEHHVSTSVIQYLLDLNIRTLKAVDYDNNTALHYACRGGKYETITLLLEKYDALAASKRNAQNKLPIELLWESDAVLDRESIEFTGSVFRLLKAYPEVIMSVGYVNMKRQAKLGEGPYQNGKKRKYSNA
eukprot:scaffold29173_cov154-Skeletonema_menzelii.AAC.2